VSNDDAAVRGREYVSSNNGAAMKAAYDRGG